MRTATSRRYTFDDLWDFPDDGQRRELIDGVLYVSPAARIPHQRVVGRLFRIIADWTDEHGGEVFPGGNVDLSDDTHFEPDVFYVRSDRDAGDGLGLTEPPDLVIEVSSPSTRSFDLGVKRDRYATEGTPEFWFVDLDAREILVSVLRDDNTYGDAEILRPGDTLTSALFPGLAIDVNQAVAAGRGKR